MAGMNFRADDSGVDEKNIHERDPRRLVVKLARLKALAVARRHPAHPVLGADTIVVCAGKALGKPRNFSDAVDMLTLQSGRWSHVYTGVALVVGGRIFTELAVSKVMLRRLERARLRQLAAKHMDKAGAYAVQDRTDPFVSRIVGDYDNVVGLPMRSVRRLLARAAAVRRLRRAV